MAASKVQARASLPPTKAQPVGHNCVIEYGFLISLIVKCNGHSREEKGAAGHAA